MSNFNLPNSPLVSIIIPTFNRAHLIGETIQSIINQTYTQWELIIVDDGSEDDTERVISGITHPKIKYVCMEHCGIFGKVRNEGLKMASGEYIAFLDSDDIWSSEKLELQVNSMQRFPEATFIFTNVELFGKGFWPSPPDYDELYVGDILLSILEESRFVFYPSTLLFKKEQIIAKLGLMDEKLPYGTDTKYFLNMCQHFKGIFLNRRLVKIRKHERSTSQNYTPEVFIDNINILHSIYEDKSIDRHQYMNILRHYYYKMGLSELHHKRPTKAYAAFSKYIGMTPLHWKGYIRMLQALLLFIK